MRISVAALAVLLAWAPAGAEGTPAPEPTVEWIRPEAVPERADRLLRRLADLRPDAAAEASLERIEQALPALRSDLEAALARAADAITTLASATELEDVRRELTDLATPFVAWRRELSAEAKRVADALDLIARAEAAWTETRRRPETVAAGDVVVRRVDRSVRSIGQAGTDLRPWRSRVLAANDRVIDRIAAVERVQGQLEAAMLQERASLFVPDRAPLWARGLGDELLRELPRVPGEVVAYAESSAAYVARDPRTVFAQVLLAALLMVGLGRFARRALERLAGEQGATRAVRLLERPYAIGLLVALIASPVFHPLAPRRFTQILALLALLPAARILMSVSARAHGAAFAGLFLLLLLERLGAALQPLPTVDRLVYLLTLASSLGLGSWYALRLRRDAGATLGQRRAIHLALAGLVLALSLEVGGWTGLAGLIGRAIIAGAIAALYVYAAILAVSAVLAYALASGTARRSHLLARNAARVQLRMERLLWWLGAALWLFYVASAVGLRSGLVDVLAAVFGAGITVGALSLSVGGILAFVSTLVAAFLLARLVTALLEEEVYPRTTLPRGVPYALSALVRYAVYAFGFLFALAAAGVRLDQAALLIGGLGVGVGLGLQDLVKNFAAGLTLLFERRVYTGDVLEMPSQGIFGRVLSIGIRASVIRCWNGAEVVVPNADLVSNAITNWTLSDQLCRIEVPVGVAYGSDPEHVIGLLLAAARSQEPLLREPAPQALFKGFGESSLDFVVRAWTDRGYDQALLLTSALGVAVHHCLRDAGVVIPFPQRDLHLVSAPAAAGEVAGPGR